MKFDKHLLNRRRAAYQQVFNNASGQLVLADLKRFCRATTPTANVNNPYATFLCEGRREVWLRIQAFLSLDEDAIAQLTEELNDD